MYVQTQTVLDVIPNKAGIFGMLESQKTWSEPAYKNDTFNIRKMAPWVNVLASMF